MKQSSQKTSKIKRKRESRTIALQTNTIQNHHCWRSKQINVTQWWSFIWLFFICAMQNKIKKENETKCAATQDKQGRSWNKTHSRKASVMGLKWDPPSLYNKRYTTNSKVNEEHYGRRIHPEIIQKMHQAASLRFGKAYQKITPPTKGKT